ncbi:magnesium-translocating P-type ATPase [Ralstonia sp.]|uniref:magnesium-translocating P-type ATPase n=1 Tax=Ralstonia sp. TaxID=54061 RepID=UPI0031D5F908
MEHHIDLQASPFWSRPLRDLQAELGTGAQGLTTAAADRLSATVGENRLRARRRRTLALEYLAHFRNPLVLLLLGASGMSALLGDATSFVVIALIVAGSVTLDFVQEHRAGNAAERLRDSVALRATVLRDGQPVRLPAAQLVPGDLVQLAAGDLVPADGRVVAALDFFVQQSVLTGEAFPVEKRAADLGPEAREVADAVNAAFMGSSVLSGSATLLVCRTGPSTFLGGIADTLREPAGPTAFELGTRRFSLLIVRMTFALVLFIVFVHVLAHRPVHETVMFAVALAVGLTPELLPMIVSVTLSRGALRMSAHKVVVKRLAAIQNLGSMDVLCTDKTGTLTEAAIRLERHVDAQGRDSARVLRLAYLNSFFESGLRSPLDDAIREHKEVDVGGWRKVDEVPFGFERRRVSVLAECTSEGRLLVVKGAPEDMLRLCVQYEAGEAGTADPGPILQPMDDAARSSALSQFEALSREGFRVLAIAWRAVGADHGHAVVDDETQLVLCGFAAFLDPAKASAAVALEQLKRSNVRVKVLSGDNEWVTRHVCAQVGLPIRHLLTGAQIDQLDDPALAALAQRTDAFCRVSPPQKSRVLRALRRRGHVVGFLGDGVNDAPALHDADVGISVDSAVDVAKDAADMILLEHDLGVLHDGVIEGRRTFANVMKYIMMGTSSNFGNMFSMAGASLVLPFLPMLPMQILLNNLLYDASEVPIPLDDVDADYLSRPHNWDPNFIRRFMLTLGPVSSLFDFATFGLLLWVFQAQESLFRTGWFIESIATQVLVIFVIRTRGRPWASRPQRWLVAAALAAVSIAVALPFTPLASLLGFVAPPPGLLLLISALTLVYLGCAELAKHRFYRATVRRRAARRV